MLEQPYPKFGEILISIGEAGRCLAENNASEGAAGNISVYLGWLARPFLSPALGNVYARSFSIQAPS